MRFTVRRTSEWDDEAQPCDGAVLADLQTYGYFTFRSVKEANKRYPDRTFERYGDGVRSDRGVSRAWFVIFDDLDDLVDFYQQHGSLVISPDWRNNEQPCIEIYDTYRE